MNVNNIINKRAFTIVEFMIAISLALLITTIVSKAIISGTRSANRLSSKVYGQKSVRSALNFIAKDLMAAESITNPAIGITDSSLTIRGTKFKNAEMTSAWPTNADTTQFKAAGSSQGVAWTKGKPPVIYIDGDPVDPTTTEYTLNYVEGLIDFTSEDPPERAVTADFSTDITITYSLDTIDNNTRLMRGTLVIADNVENTDIFEREADKMFNIKVLSREFELITTIDASTGSYVIPLTAPTAEKLNSAFFTNENKGWLAGDNGALFEFDGVAQTWTNQSIVDGDNLNSINFADKSTGTIVGNNGTVLQYAGGAWSPPSNPVSNDLTGVLKKDTNSILTVGVNAGEGISYTYDGAGWQNKTNSSGTEPFSDVSGYFKNKYAVANDGKVYRISANDGDVEIKSGYTINIADIFNRDDLEGVITRRGDNKGLNSASTYNPDNGSVPRFANVIIRTNASFTTSNLVRLEFEAAETLTIESSAKIDATAKGYEGGLQAWGGYRNGTKGSGPGGGGGGNLNGSAGGGGGYGGNGGEGGRDKPGAGGISYGAYPEEPTFGSGGGGGHSGGNDNPAGGRGGGAIKIKANYIVNNGTIEAKGGAPYQNVMYGNAPGSGGGIYLESLSTIDATRIFAEGGDAPTCSSTCSAGGGGGGRITFNAQITGVPALEGGDSGRRWPDTWWEAEDGEGGQYVQISKPFSFSETNEWKEFYDAGNQNLNGISITENAANPAEYQLYVVGNGGIIYQYDSAAGSWDDKNDNNGVDVTATTQNLNAVHFFDENTGWAVGDAGTILRYDGELDQWFEIPSGTNDNLNDVFMYSKDEGYIVGDNGTLLKVGSVRL